MRFDPPTGAFETEARTSGAVTAESKTTLVRFDDQSFTVGVALFRWPNGGSWSFFRAPCCGRQARTLRLFDGDVFCSRCLIARGVRPRTNPLTAEKRAALRIPKLLAKLNGGPARLNPPDGSYKLDRRHQIVAELRRCQLVLRRARLKGVRKALSP